MRNLIALVSGLIFGLGLIAGGMTNPAKIKGFLDLFGSWDPSLALVMGGAIAVAVFAFTAAKQRDRSWTGNSMVRLMTLPKNCRRLSVLFHRKCRHHRRRWKKHRKTRRQNLKW